MDALGIYSEMVFLRMGEPPGQKKVPLQFPCWVCMDEMSRAENAFKHSQLIMDRYGGHHGLPQIENRMTSLSLAQASHDLGFKTFKNYHCYCYVPLPLRTQNSHMPFSSGSCRFPTSAFKSKQAISFTRVPCLLFSAIIH